jgi:beta-lactamase regulating signal transducer with metallopeptidase domain/biopolymer transport protein ExbD
MNDIMNEISHLWFHNYSFLLIQNSLFIGLILLLLHFSKKLSAGFKYFICAIAFIKLIIPPFLALNFSTEYIYTNFAPGIIAEKTLTDADSIHPETSSPMVDFTGAISWIEIFFIVWVTGVFIFLIISTFRLIRLTFALRDATPAKKETYSQHVTNPNVNVYISKSIPMPLTLVLFPNRIFVPVQWAQWNVQCRRVVVKHEETHLRRHDNLIQIVQVLAQSLYFFNPLVFLLNKRMNSYREMACDDAAVVNGIKSRLEYSKCLTEIAEKAVRVPAIYRSTSAFFYQKSELSNRIHYQMEEGVMSNKSRKNHVFILFLLISSIPFFSWFVNEGKVESSIVTKMPQEIIDLKIFNEDDVRVNGNKIPLKGLKPILADISKDLDDPVLHLKFDNKASMKLVFAIEKTLRELDLLNVRFLGDKDLGLDLMLPNTASEEQLKKIDKKHLLNLLILKDGRVKTDDFILASDELGQFIGENLKKDEYMIVSIKAEEDAVYKDYVRVLDQVGKSGCKRILIHENVK